MTGNEINELAYAIGIETYVCEAGELGNITQTQLIQFARAIEAATREECAKVCDRLPYERHDRFEVCAEAIRGMK